MSINKADIDLSLMHQLATSGYSKPKIAKYFGVSEQTIYRRFYPDQAKKHCARNLERQRTHKRLLVEYKGGKCCIPGCGYDKCHAALVFHHLRDKTFTISRKRCFSLDRLKKEADKTILICSNCHAEVHEGSHDKFINNLLSKMV